MKLHKQQGFTLIELVMVIVILGVLAAVALPKFVDVTDDAKNAAIAGVAGAANSAMSINYSGCLVNNNTPLAGKCVKVSVCSDIKNLLQGNALPAGYELAADAKSQTTNGANFTCTITGNTKTATFTGIAAGLTNNSSQEKRD